MQTSAEVHKLLVNPEVNNWFTNDWEVKAEAEILLKTGLMKRPDRIMIGKNNVIVVDYKFGEKEEEAHNRQVLNYKNKLRQMGYKNVEAYLWYVFQNKIITVTDKPVQGKLF
ncbi:MAG: Dna2/Cas4 domain-containing protein [Bacteroidales bacterium]|nr:Dna2/Cas4 domain-containing protein [Bacteroidales bacterium]